MLEIAMGIDGEVIEIVDAERNWVTPRLRHDGANG
jgi:hypothetical protein